MSLSTKGAASTVRQPLRWQWVVNTAVGGKDNNFVWG